MRSWMPFLGLLGMLAGCGSMQGVSMDVVVSDGSTRDVPDSANHEHDVVTMDVGCSGSAPICLNDLGGSCGDVAVNAQCQGASYVCPTGTRLESLCPLGMPNPAGCPTPGRMGMNGETCSPDGGVLVCNYRGDPLSVSCPGNQFQCVCGGDAGTTWDCHCLLR